MDKSWTSRDVKFVPVEALQHISQPHHDISRYYPPDVAPHCCCSPHGGSGCCRRRQEYAHQLQGYLCHEMRNQPPVQPANERKIQELEVQITSLHQQLGGVDQKIMLVIEKLSAKEPSQSARATDTADRNKTNNPSSNDVVSTATTVVAIPAASLPSPTKDQGLQAEVAKLTSQVAQMQRELDQYAVAATSGRQPTPAPPVSSSPVTSRGTATRRDAATQSQMSGSGQSMANSRQGSSHADQNDETEAQNRRIDEIEYFLNQVLAGDNLQGKDAYVRQLKARDYKGSKVGAKIKTAQPLLESLSNQLHNAIDHHCDKDRSTGENKPLNKHSNEEYEPGRHNSLQNIPPGAAPVSFPTSRVPPVMSNDTERKQQVSLNALDGTVYSTVTSGPPSAPPIYPGQRLDQLSLSTNPSSVQPMAGSFQQHTNYG